MTRTQFLRHHPYLLCFVGNKGPKILGILGCAYLRLCISHQKLHISCVFCLLSIRFPGTTQIQAVEMGRVYKMLAFTVIRHVSHLKNVAEEIYGDTISIYLYIYIYLYTCVLLFSFSTCDTTPPYLSSYHLYFALWGMLCKKLQYQ